MGIPIRGAFSSLSLSPKFRLWITFNNLFKKPNKLWILNFFLQNRQKGVVIHTIKELFNITLQGIASTSIVLRLFSQHFFYCYHSFVSAFSPTTGKRVSNEDGFKHPNQCLVNSVMKYSVSNRGFMNMPTLRIGDKKVAIPTVTIGFILQISMKLKKMLFQVLFKINNIIFSTLAPPEFLPGYKQALRVNYFIK